MKKIQNIIGVAVLLIIIVVLIIISRRRDARNRILDKTAAPFYTNIVNKRLISGNLYPMKEVEIKSPISGILEKTYVEIGEKVKTGQKLAKVKLVPDPAQIETAKTRLKSAEITYEQDKIDYDRKNKLYETNVISQADYDASRKSYLLSQEQYESAQNQLTLLQEGFIKSSNISNLVEATIDGTVISLPLEEGAPVMERSTFSSGSTIAVLAQLDTFLFKGKVVESDIIALHKGLKINVTLPVEKDLKLQATISKISPMGKLDNGVMKYDFEATLLVPDSVTVYSGFNATAEIIIARRDSVLAIQEKNLIIENDSMFVQILNDKLKPKKHFIKTGLSDGLNIEVLSGLKPDQKIVVQ